MHGATLPCYRWRRSYALTRQTGVDSWQRLMEPLCGPCWRALDEARTEGRIAKATGERSYLGHGTGLFDVKGVRQGDP